MSCTKTVPRFRPRRLAWGRSAATAVRWPVGVTLTSWRYVWRTTPIHRVEEPGCWRQDAPPPLPDGLVDDDVQHVTEGAGPFFHRRYRATIRHAAMSAAELMATLQDDLDRAAPREFASFKKVHGEADRMRAGDEYVVRMPGPWDGPVRVTDAGASSFHLATLQGHLEAGQIRFSARDGGKVIEFEIESWARSGDRLASLLYAHLRLSKEVQLHMWISFLEGVIGLSGGERDGGLEVHTWRVDEVPDA